MAFIPKLLARPGLQLLVLMLVLVAGLSPKNSMAQDDPAASPDADASPTADDTSGAGSAVGPSAEKATGRADAKTVKCYKDYCRSNAAIGGTEEKCLKKSDNATPTKDCETGYCYTKLVILKGTKGDLLTVDRDRDCAKPLHVSCIKNKPGSCWKPTNLKELTAFRDCAGRFEARSDDNGVSREYCVCDKDYCNGEPPASSGPTGAKHLGFNVAIVGARLVSISPLKTLFLVG